jgi:hypothetical protein
MRLGEALVKQLYTCLIRLVRLHSWIQYLGTGRYRYPLVDTHPPDKRSGSRQEKSSSLLTQHSETHQLRLPLCKRGARQRTGTREKKKKKASAWRYSAQAHCAFHHQLQKLTLYSSHLVEDLQTSLVAFQTRANRF